jgi:hypothetical protein
MKKLFILTTILACCAMPGERPFTLEVNFGGFECTGRLDGDMWTVVDDIPCRVTLRELTGLERRWCKTNIKDVDPDVDVFLPNRAVEVQLPHSYKDATILLFTKSCKGSGESRRYVGVAYLYDRGKLTRGSFVQKTLDWDEKSGYMDRIRSKSPTGCPECDRIVKEGRE